MTTLTYHNGWEIHWSGWRAPANQFVLAGFWMARKGDALKVASTMGRVADSGELWTVDLTLQPGWPVVTPRTPVADREQVKARALDVLREVLH